MSDLANGLRVAGAQVEAFGQAVVDRVATVNLWSAALVVGALALDRALSRRVRASWRIALYAPVALRVVLPMSWGLALPGAPRVTAMLAPLARIGGHSAEPLSTWQTPSWYALVAVVYLAVAAVLAGRAVLARVRLGRALADARPVSMAHAELPCPVVQHDELGPMAVGLLAPRIVVPRHLLDETEAPALACVLRHEAAHLRRRDAWLSAAMQLLAVLAWPVVPVWIAIARVRQLIELACDEAALASADESERRRYGHALLDIAQWRTVASLTVAPLGAGELHFGSTLRARIEALAAQRHWPRAAQLLVLAVVPMALFAACGGSAAMPGPSAAADSSGDYGYQYDVDPARSVGLATAASSAARNAEGRIPPETIQGIVRANFGAFRTCYETALAKTPTLAGRVTVSYVIGEDGTTLQASDLKSTMPDKDVVDCVVSGFKKLTYPKPEGGVVTVVYPIEFAP